MSLVLWDVLQEHLEEAAFLYTQWERARRSPRLSVGEVAAGVEERLLARVDALVLGEQSVRERLLVPALADESADPEITWAAAFALLEGGEVGSVLKALVASGGAPERAAAVGRALELSAAKALEDRLRPLLRSASPAVAVAALRVLAARGEPLGDRLDDLIASPAPELAAAALGLLGAEPPSIQRREAVERALESESEAVRDAALRAGLRMRLRVAWNACVKRPSSPLALAALAMGGDEDHLGQVEALLADDARRAEALFALGLSGRVRAVDACLPWLADKKAGGLAGDVFATITGAAIAGRLEGKRPEEDEEAEEAPDAAVALEPEEDLPVPEPEAVKALWEKRRPKFRPELRYLGGEPLTAARLSSAFHEGPMWRRPMRALELAVRTQATPPDLARWARKQRAGAAAGFRHYDERPFEAFFT